MGNTANNRLESFAATLVASNLSNVEQESLVFYRGYLLGWFLEVTYLSLLSIVGIVGNLLVIFSIINGKKVNKSGNILIINVAVVDLIVTGFLIPIIIASLVTGRNVLSETECVVAGYVLCLSCACSVSTLACISFNRYWSVVHNQSYQKIFSQKALWLTVVMNWVWANLLIMPTLLGWSQQTYDKKVNMCTLDASKSRGYNIFLMALGIGLPMIITAFCYWKLYAAVINRSKHVRKWSTTSTSAMRRLERNKLKKQWSFARTLLVTVAALLLCFLPFGISILFDQDTITTLSSKVVGRLILSNFGMNFIIYGAMNSGYRSGYVDLLKRIFCVKKWRKMSFQMSFENSSTSTGTKSGKFSFRKRTSSKRANSQSSAVEKQQECHGRGSVDAPSVFSTDKDGVAQDPLTPRPLLG